MMTRVPFLAANVTLPTPIRPEDDWSSHLLAIFHGVAYGVLHVIGPDHLGTLLAFSVSAPPLQALWLGASWSVGHCAGMVVIAGVLALIEKLAHIRAEDWEHYGNYAIGVSLILCGLYFILRRGTFLREDKLGNVTISQCSCCGPEAGGFRPARSGRPRLVIGELPARPAYASIPDELPTDLPTEASPLQAKDLTVQACWQDATGLIVGLLQGLCCPMGLVGLVFMAGKSALNITLFIVVFALVSTIGMATFAAAWSWVVHVKARANGWTTGLYLASCALTISLGVGWLLANYFGVVDILDVHPHRQTRTY